MIEQFVVGFHPVREILRHDPKAIRRILIEAGRGGQRRREIEELCHRHEVRWAEVSAAELGRRGRGVVSNGFGAELRSMVASASDRQRADLGLVVLAEDVQDPRNLGALLRVCEGAGVGRFLLREHGSASLGEVAAKASAGAASWLPVEKIGSPATIVEKMKSDGFWVYGLALDGKPPWEVDLTGKVLLCVGGEEKGLRRRTREACDRTITLPMRGHVDSLNLATAAAAVLYEAVRQRSCLADRGAAGGGPSLSDQTQER